MQDSGHCRDPNFSNITKNAKSI